MLTPLVQFYERSRRRKWGAALRLFRWVALGVTVHALSADACRIALTSVGLGVVAASPLNLPPIPRNAAFVGSRSDGDAPLTTAPIGVTVDSTSSSIMGRMLMSIGSDRRTFIAKPDEPLSPDLEFLSGGHRYKTGDYLDETPPSAPRITDGNVEQRDESACGGESSCAGLGLTSLIVEIAEPAKDDLLPAGLVAYAIYLEKSAEQARTARNPFALVSYSGPALVTFPDASWADSDAFVAVSAMDWAGNESPRSEPYQVNGSGIGCAVSVPRKHRPTFAIALMMLAGLGWARRTVRPKSAGSA